MYQYKVLLVDDEPLVLAGIKFMVNWSDLSCELIGNAKNGKQAYQIIEEVRPDIVIADINMPIMNGIELLKKTQEQYPDTVFIMLTNLQEFELARECIRYHAVDYLVKTQMEEQMLKEALEKGKTEVNKRRKLSIADFEESCEQINVSKVLSDSMIRLISTSYLPDSIIDFFGRNGILDSFLLISFQFTFSEHQLFSGYTYQEYDKLYNWEWEIVEELAGNCFEHFSLFSPDRQDSAQMFLLLWGSRVNQYDATITTFRKKLAVASEELTGLCPCILMTDVLSGKEELLSSPQQMKELRNYFYLKGGQFACYKDIPQIDYKVLDVKGKARMLKRDLENRNISSAVALLDETIYLLENDAHKRETAIDLCNEFYFIICEAIKESADGLDSQGLFADPVQGYTYLKYLITRNDVIQFLLSMSNEMQTMLQPALSKYDDIIKQVKKYVITHIQNKIALAEVAQQVYLSPSYLSVLFKKHCGESLVDYINRKKMEKACEMLLSDQYLINQVSELLSFDNAYYFTRVFKRYVGVTPREYQERERKKRRNIE